MRNNFRCLVVAVVLSGIFLAILPVNSASGQETSQPGEAMLHSLVEKYFEAYGKKDLVSMVGMWSEKSPDLTGLKRNLKRQFDSRDLTVSTPLILKQSIEPEKIVLRVGFRVTSIVVSSKYKRDQQFVRTIELRKEADQWKIWRFSITTDELASMLVKAGSDAEKQELLKKEKDLITPELVQSLVNQGARLVYQGNYARAQAIDFFANQIAQQTGDKAAIGMALCMIAGIYHFQRSNDEAADYYQKSLAMSVEARDKEGMARALGSIGELERSRGDYIQAMEHFQDSLSLSKEAGDDSSAALMLGTIGDLHRQQGNYDQAMEYLQNAIALARAIDDRVAVAHIVSDVARVYSLQGEYTKALDIYNQQLARLSGTGHDPGTLITHTNIGDIYLLQGKYDQALDEYQKSLKLSEAVNYKEATTTNLSSIAEAYRLKGDYAQAFQYAERAIALGREIGYEEILWDALTTAGKASLGLNRPDKARKDYEEAIELVETLRNQVAGGEQDQERSFESLVAPYHAMVDLLAGQGKFEEALAFAERAKGRVLLDVVHNGHVDINKAMTTEEQAQERKLNSQLVDCNSQFYSERLQPQPDEARLAELESRLKKARLDFEAFQTNLYTAHPELKTQRGEARPLTLEEADTLFPDNETAVLEFVVSEERIFLFVLTKADRVSVKVYPIKLSEKELNAAIEGYRQMLSTLDNRFSKPSHDLYDLLINPASEQLKGKKRITIVPDGPLWELPFQTLQTPKDRYLIDDHVIFYAPSLTVLREIIKTRSKQPPKSGQSPTLLALGNPILGKRAVDRVGAVHMDEKLDPLPESEQQVRSIGEIYGQARSKIYVGAEAREERFKSEARNYSILHLATHGILNDRSPMYSQLLLAQTAPGSKEDGVLEAWELMTMDLKADIAVLSACETARGRIGRGEGVIGLSWALFVAGVPTTVVSQWKVRSDSTTELMVEFHRQLKARIASNPGKSFAADALRAAALKVKANSKYQHPFHWAGFVVIGYS